MLSTVAKKRLTYITFGSYFFMGGIEYAVILPSTWLYIHSTYGAPKYIFGIIMAAFSFSGLFAGPLMGRWADKSRRVKLIIMFGACWEIVGSFMYFVGISQWFLVASRLVAGVGTGGEAVIIADIARFTSEQDRTKVISRLIAIRQTGLLLGPGLNFFLTKANFYIGPFIVNEYTAPGFPTDMTAHTTAFDDPVVDHWLEQKIAQWKTSTEEALMTVLWFILNILIFFMFTELEHIVDKYQLEREVRADYTTPPSDEPNLYSEDQSSSAHIPDSFSSVVQDNSSTQVHSHINYDSDFEGKPIKCKERLSSDENLLGIANSVEYSSMLIESAEKFLTSDSSVKRRSSTDSEKMNIVEDYYKVEKYEYESFPQSSKVDCSIEKPSDQYKEKLVIGKWRFFLNEYVREEIVTLLAIQFNSIFAQVSMETLVTPLTDKYLGWGEFENSIMYASAGLEIIIFFLLVGWLSKHIEDRKMLILGSVAMAVANSWLVYVLPRLSPDTPSETLWRFIVGIVIDMFSLPFLMVCSVSLYSKLVSKEHQGLSQGFRRSVIGIATILAPLWAGSTFDMPYIMVGVMVALVGLSLVMLVFSFDRLKVPPSTNSSTHHARKTTADEDERQPLLA